MPIPEIGSFGDADHLEGETGLTIVGAGYGAFPGSAWMYQNSDRTGLSDQLTIATWADLQLSGVDIPGSPNNAPGTVFLFVQREDLAWSQAFTFTLTASGVINSGALSAIAAAILTVETESDATAEVSADAAGVLTGEGAAAAESELSADAAAILTGEGAAIVESEISADAAALLALLTASVETISAELSITAKAAVTLVGEDATPPAVVVAPAEGGYAYYTFHRRERELERRRLERERLAILEDEAEVLQIILELLPWLETADHPGPRLNY